MSHYKYTIYDKLRQLSVEDYETAMKFFPVRLNIHPQTFRGWIYIKKTDKAEIANGYLFQIALFFDCSPIELHSEWKNIQNEIMDEWKVFRDKQLNISTSHVQD